MRLEVDLGPGDALFKRILIRAMRIIPIGSGHILELLAS
jgi:hypothetical protein